jgi:hypothetical protein
VATKKVASFARLIDVTSKVPKIRPPKDRKNGEAVAASYNYGNSSSAAVSRAWQHQVAHYYGDVYDVRTTIAHGVGELRFGVGWLAQQVARLGWKVEIDGKLLPGAKSEEYVNLVSDRQATEQVAANIALFGELAYAAYPAGNLPTIDGAVPVDPALTTPGGPIYAGSGDTRWRVVSVVDDDREALLGQASMYVIGLKPSPIDPLLPDSPVAGVLDALHEIEQLSALSKAQTRSRLQTVGILGVASELSVSSSDMPHNAPDSAVGQDTDDFAEMLKDAISRQMDDPETTSAIPILLRAPAEMLAEGGWAAWLQMSHSYDEVLAARLDKAIQRLAYGLPMPTEILLGMSASNRAVAFQIEEAGYKEHVEPFALATGQVYASALMRILDLPETAVVKFIPDPTALLARQHSVEDAITAWNLGLVSAKWVRSVLGIDEENAPTPEDLALLLAVQGNSDQPTAATGGQRPGEPHTKDGSAQTPIDGEPTEGAVPSTEPVAAALAAALQMSVFRAREKVGAKVRTAVRSDEFVTRTLNGVPNSSVAVTLGEPVVTSAIDVKATIEEATAGVKEWWSEYRETAADDASSQVLHHEVVRLAMERLYEPCSLNMPIPGEIIDEVLELV